MTQEHPIIPPPELFKQWEDDILNERDNVDHVLDCAWRNGFQAGADQELEACCEWLRCEVRTFSAAAHLEAQRRSDNLRTARRPKLPSLKEQALAALDDAVVRGDCITVSEASPIIRRALESLPS